MANNKLSKTGSVINDFIGCKDEGYSNIACGTSIVIKEGTNIGVTITGSSLIATGTATGNIPSIVYGSGLIIGSNKISSETKNLFLSFCEKDESKEKIIINDGGMDSDEEREIRLRPETRHRQIINHLDDIRVTNEYNYENEMKKMDNIENNITMGKKELLKQINEIQQSTNTTNEIQTKIQNLITLHCKTKNEKLDIINENYEIMFKNSCKMSYETKQKYNNDENFKKENNKLENMIKTNQSSSEIIKQHAITMKTIEDNNYYTKQLKEFNNNVKICGSVGSCLANLYGRPQEAQHINTLTSSTIELSLIGAGIMGYGAMSCINPYALGAMATVTLLNSAMSLSQSNGTSPFIGIYQILTSIMNSIDNLKKTMIHYFNLLDVKLNKMEANIVKHLIDNFDMNYETQCNLKQLCADTLRYHEYTTLSIETINTNIIDLKNKIVQQEAQNIIKEIGSLISEVYVNLDVLKFSDYSNKLVGKLLHPYDSTDITIVGEYEKFDENSVPVLSVNSLPNLQLRNIYSNIKKYEFLKSIKSSNVYISQYMNSSQIISSMFEIKNQIPGCMSFYTFYNEFINSSNNVGLFPFEIEETSIIIAISKEISNCSMYIFGIIGLTIDIKLSNILVNLNLSISKIINVNNCEINVLKILTHLAVQENIYIVSEELFEKDSFIVNSKFCELIDTEFENVNHILYTSISDALMLLKINQYEPRTIEDSKFIKISDNEMNQIFSIAHIIQKNIQSISLLKNPKIFEYLCEDYTNKKHILQDIITKTYEKELNYQLSKFTDSFINGQFMNLTECDNFTEEITVTKNALNWWSGHRTVSNDRGCGAGSWNTSNKFLGDSFNEYENEVRKCANEFRKQHLIYIEKCKKNMRDNKSHPKINLFHFYFTTKSITYDNKFITQLPFFIYPSTAMGKNITLPLFQKIREPLMEHCSKLDIFKIYNTFVFHNFGKYKIYYFFSKENVFSLQIWFEVNNKIIGLKNEFNNCVYYEILNYSTIFENTQLDLTKTEALWTWWCGGIAGCGQKQRTIDNWVSHIPNNWSNEWVYVPNYKHRASIIDNPLEIKKLTTGNVFDMSYKINNKNIEILDNELQKFLNEILYYPTTKKIFNKSLSNSLNNAYNLYLSTVNALYTYDYFTYNKLLSNNIIIKKYNDFSFSIKKNTEILNPINYFNDIKKDEILKRYKTSEFIGTKLLVNCLSNITLMTERFGNYISKGLSTPEIVKTMLSCVNNLYTSHKNLLNEIQQTMELSEGDKTIKLNEIIKEYTEQLADIKNTNCLKIKN